MKKNLVIICIFFVVIAVTTVAYSEISDSEAVSYCNKATGVSSEVLGNFFSTESKLLGEVSDTLGAFEIIDKMKNADDKGAVLSAANFASMKIISKVMPRGASILTALDIYCTSLSIIHDYVWIPNIKEKIYQKYKENRDGEADPEEALLGVQRYINPVLADIKEKNIYPKYNMEIITSEKMRQQYEKRMDAEAIAFMEAMFEERYNKEKLVKAVLASEDAVKKSMDKTLEKLKEKLTMEIQGQIRDRESKSSTISGARVWVKDYGIGVFSNKNGVFRLVVPYKKVKDKPFRIAVSKEGYKPALSNKSFSFSDETIKSLDCYLSPLEEKPVSRPKPKPKPSQGQDRRRER